MCLAVPMEIVRIDGVSASVRQNNTEIEIDISLLESPKPGDYVIVHAGYALEIIETGDAAERIELLNDFIS